jgi:alkylhydroperoxidase/carboxymuconolactone decarboxylase family protein YurZ
MLAQPVCPIASSSGGTMADGLEDFQKFRTDLNEEILGCGHLGIKRFFALDHQAYEPGLLGTKNKELLGLVASAVLRCDDCSTCHLVRCSEEGWKREEGIDALNMSLIVGGSITILTCGVRLQACAKSAACNLERSHLRYRR